MTGERSTRLNRVEKEIREVIGFYLISGFRGELPGMVTVSRVICSRDLRTAKVFVTVMPIGEAADVPKSKLHDETVEALQSNAYEIQGEINRKLRMKHCPRVTFLYDEGFEKGLKIENTLRQISTSSTGEGVPRQSADQNADQGAHQGDGEDASFDGEDDGE